MFTTKSISETTFQLQSKDPNSQEFHILQITDMHMGHFGPEKGRMYQEIRQMCEHFKVDLVINTGDLFCDYPEFLIHHILDEFEKNVPYPWALAWGNHDQDKFKPNHWLDLFDRIESHLLRLPHCLYKETRHYFENYGSDSIADDPREYEACIAPTQAIDPKQDKKTQKKIINEFNGFYGGNYKIQVYNPETQEPAWDLFILNSRRTYHIPPKVLRWMKDQMESQTPQLPALLFYHVPNYEFEKYWDDEHAHGIKGEKVCFEKDRSEIHDFFKTLPPIKGCFVGHDHLNDYYVDVDGIQYCYGRKTGAFAYGGRRNVKGQFEFGRRAIRPGATLITLKFNSNENDPTNQEWDHISVFADGSTWKSEKRIDMGTIKPS